MGILKEKHFSIEFFNEDGFDIASELTGLEMDELIFEKQIGNHLIGQTEEGRYYLFCEPGNLEDEITFNSFLRLVAQ